MNDLDYLDLFNDIGFLLLKNGAEIYRVEESMTHMCQAYGFTNIEIFAIPTYYTLSLTLTDGTLYNKSIRSRRNRVHLDRLYELNTLIRQISNKELSYDDISQRIEAIKNSKLNLPLIFFGYVFSAAMFALFFGGGVSEMIVAGIIGGILYFAIYLMELFAINSIVRSLVGSMILSALAILAYKCHLIINQQATITGALMILVPGIAITNSLRDIIGGDFVSGLSRMIEAILTATAIAVGVGIMLMVLKGV